MKFIIMMLLYSRGDCIKYTLPRAEGIPMLITGHGEKYYDVFYTYPGIGDIHFRANAERLERDTISIDKSKCDVYTKKLGQPAK